MKRIASIIFFFLALHATLTAQKQAKTNKVVQENILMDAVSKLQTSPSKAITELRFLDEKFPPNDAVKYYLGLVAQGSGEFDKAESYLKQAIELDSTNIWYKDALAGLYASAGKAAESTEIYLELLEKYPSNYTNAYTLTLLGDRYLSQYKDSLAIESYNRALVYSPDYIPAIIGRAEANRMSGNIPAFFVDAHTFIKDPDVRPSAKSAYINQIIKFIDYRFFRSWGAQLDTLVNSCVKTHPTDSTSLKLAGSWYYSTERKETGRRYFDRLIEEYPKDLDAHYIRLSLLFDGGNMKEVLDQCYKIIEIGGEKNPKVLPALSTAGDCWHALGNDRKAMKIYEKVLRIDPEHVPTLNNYAYYLSLSGKKLKKAEKMSRITIEKEPDNPSYLDTYGWILHLLGRNQEAKPYFKKAMVYGGKDSVVILEHYSVVLKALGEEELSQYYKSLAENKKAEQ